MSKLLRTFKQTYKLKPGCHPLLSLTRLALDRLLHEGSFLDTKDRMQLAESVNLGLPPQSGLSTLSVQYITWCSPDYAPSSLFPTGQ